MAAQEEARAAESPGLDRLLRPLAAASAPASLACAVAFAVAAGLAAAADSFGLDPFGAGVLTLLPVLAGAWTLNRRCAAGVVTMVVFVEVVATAFGALTVPAAAGRLVMVIGVAAAGRAVAFAVSRAWRVREREAGKRVADLADFERCLHHGLELAVEVGRSLAPREVAQRTIDQMVLSLRAAHGMFARLDDGKLVVVAVHGLDAAGAGLRLPRLLPAAIVETVPEMSQALATGHAVLGGALRAGAGGEELAVALPAGVHTVVFPGVVGDRPICLFAFGRDGGTPFGEGDVTRIGRMADVAMLALSSALSHVRMVQAQRAASLRSSRLEQAIDAAEDIGAGQELADVTKRVLVRACEVSGADRGSISRLEGEWIVLEHDFRPTGGYPKPAARRELAKSRMAAAAIRGRRPVHGRIEPTSVGPDGMAWLARADLLYALQCPLVVEDEVVGVLGLARTRDEPFNDQDVEALLPFARLSALLLRNARHLAEARQTGQARSAFLHLAVHELRTPLAVIRGYLSLLEDGTYPVPARTREEAVETLVVKAQELETLVESLVTAARLEGGRLPCHPAELDVGEAVAEAVERLRPRTRLEGATVSVLGPASGPIASFDRDHVGRILDNLLNNAVTYSEAPADICVEVRPGPPAEVAVRDRGHGIPSGEHERVFERFRRVDVGPAHSHAGLGLGLSISRDLARLNGCTLVLESSAPGEGSVFVLRLPP